MSENAAKNDAGPGSRTSKYRNEFDKQAYKLSLFEATDAQIADFFAINASTLYEKKIAYSEFFGGHQRGKDESRRGDGVLVVRSSAGSDVDGRVSLQDQSRAVRTEDRDRQG